MIDSSPGLLSGQESRDQTLPDYAEDAVTDALSRSTFNTALGIIRCSA
jgi:hypothetical protein